MRTTTFLLAASSAATVAVASPVVTSSDGNYKPAEESTLVEIVNQIEPCLFACMPWAAAWAGCDRSNDIACINKHKSYVDAKNLEACQQAECPKGHLPIDTVFYDFYVRIRTPECDQKEIDAADKALADGIDKNHAKFSGSKDKDPDANVGLDYGDIENLLGGGGGGSSGGGSGGGLGGGLGSIFGGGGSSGSGKKDSKSSAARTGGYTGMLALALVPLFL